jgi:thiol-disulfide isomerase/thioredoxin
MKFSFILLASLGLAFPIYSQNETVIKSLSIGDKVPDIPLSNLINYPTKTARLSDFKGKLVILDFWATWCTACVHNFPIMDSLQRQYGDILQIILVNSKSTGDNKSRVKSLFDRLKINGNQEVILPIAAEDTIADALFKHRILPHYVWLLDGEVKAITSSEQLTGDNIIAVYKGQSASLKMKKDILNYDRQKPLFVDGNGGNGENILYRSMIAGYAPGLPSGSLMKVCVTNVSILHLYQQANQNLLPKSRVILQVKQPLRLQLNYSDDWESWKYDNAYCYELIVHPTPSIRIYEKMQNDLTNYFGYIAKTETRRVKCFILSLSHRSSIRISKEGRSENNLGEGGAMTFIHNQTISTLVDYLNNQISIPVIDETGYLKPVDLEFNGELTNMNALRKILNADGFDLVESERELEMFVIKEKDAGR